MPVHPRVRLRLAPITGADVAVDPSRVAAQIVSGIGFLGAGVIFVNNDTVRGLTTAATVWLSAAIGMACGAGMIPLAATAVAPRLRSSSCCWAPSPRACSAAAAR